MIQRYGGQGDMFEDEEGGYVLFDDHQRQLDDHQRQLGEVTRERDTLRSMLTLADARINCMVAK